MAGAGASVRAESGGFTWRSSFRPASDYVAGYGFCVTLLTAPPTARYDCRIPASDNAPMQKTRMRLPSLGRPAHAGRHVTFLHNASRHQTEWRSGMGANTTPARIANELESATRAAALPQRDEDSPEGTEQGIDMGPTMYDEAASWHVQPAAARQPSWRRQKRTATTPCSTGRWQTADTQKRNLRVNYGLLSALNQAQMRFLSGRRAFRRVSGFVECSTGDHGKLLGLIGTLFASMAGRLP